MVCLSVLIATVNAQFQFVSPLPGSKYHHPQQTIIIREGSMLLESSLHTRKLFTVTGSKSNEHALECKLSDDGKTILLIPQEPFATGEEVTVVIGEGLLKLNEEPIHGFSFNFYTRLEYSTEAMLQFELYRQRVLHEDFGIKNTVESNDELSLGPPFVINVNTNPAPGELFYHNISLLGYHVEQSQIMTSNGQFLFRHESQEKGINFGINANGYLTAYNETNDAYDMFDSSYNTIQSFKAGNGYTTDVHDFLILPDGHAFIIGLDFQTVDLTVYDPDYNSNATVIGAVLQEMDASQNVIFEWRSWDHIEVTEALHESLLFSFVDYVHANSIELDTDGNLLISCRNLDQVIKINRNSGDVIWRLGGTKNEFEFLDDTLKFNYQHDARRIANGNLTLYDNGNYHPVKVSFAKEYRIDEVNMTAKKVWAYSHPFINGKPVRGYAMGNVQRLSNGNTLINWGSIYAGSVLGKGSPNLTEVDSLGNIVWEMTLDESKKGVIYRAHRYSWTPCARPTEKTLKESNITSSSAKLNWGKATNATGYSIYYKKLTDSAWLIKNASGNSKVINDLAPETTYQWYVQSKCDTNVNTVSAATKTKKFKTLPFKMEADTVDQYSVRIYPNPVSDFLFIEGLMNENSRLALMNSMGYHVIMQTQSNVQTSSLDVSQLDPGIYYLLITTAENQKVERITIVR